MDILGAGDMASIYGANSSNGTDSSISAYIAAEYGNTPREAYVIIRTASTETIKAVAPHFNQNQIEFVADMMQDQTKVKVMQDAWNKAHPKESTTA